MVVDLLTLTWEEIAAIDPENFVVMLPIAPIEEHGKHLPTGVDVYETGDWVDKAARVLERELPGGVAGILPVIPLGFADMGRFPGNIHISRKLLFDVVAETVSCIAGWGVKHIAVISGHADPVHAITIEQACEAVNREKGIVSFAPMGAIFSGAQDASSPRAPRELEEKLRQYPDDIHAGFVETSVMLHLAPELVKPHYRQRPDIRLSGRDMMDASKVAKAIEGEGHIGFPSAADAQSGAQLTEDMARKIAHAVALFVRREGYERYARHPLGGVLGRVLEKR